MCSLSTVASSTLGTGMTDTACVTWGDRWGLGDDRDYWIEVRYVSGTGCTAWTLQATGNTGSSCVGD